MKQEPWSRLLLRVKLECIKQTSLSYEFNIIDSINALTLLMAAVITSESGEGNLSLRLGTIFDIMDFDGTGQISMDGLVCDLSLLMPS